AIVESANRMIASSTDPERRDQWETVKSYILFCQMTGIRPGREVMSLRFSDFILEEKYPLIRIREGKTGSREILIMDDGVIDLYANLRSSRIAHMRQFKSEFSDDLPFMRTKSGKSL